MNENESEWNEWSIAIYYGQVTFYKTLIYYGNNNNIHKDNGKNFWQKPKRCVCVLVCIICLFYTIVNNYCLFIKITKLSLLLLWVLIIEHRTGIAQPPKWTTQHLCKQVVQQLDKWRPKCVWLYDFKCLIFSN